MPENVIKIGIFYDGNYLYHVSNYYVFHHHHHMRLSISGLHEFVREEVARREHTTAEFCRIVDAHYFRGRYTTQIVEQKGWIRGERIFEDVLMYNGVTTHFWPMTEGNEKSVDVALALEAYEMTHLRHYDVCVLVAGDSDYAPLVQKIQATGTRAMVLGWEFEFINDRGLRHETHVSKRLMADATYPVMMSDVIESGKYDPGSPISLFVARTSDNEEDEASDYWEDDVEEDEENEGAEVRKAASSENVASEDLRYGHIVLLNPSGWGFIAPEGDGVDIFFCYADLVDTTFDRLRHNATVSYTEGRNEKGPIARTIHLVSLES
ncbi:MAG: NYN domain-containing protein [Proteobacteria bacterium]|nr:NYN domain-containing protein [Pseudomonadota bacterium]MBQ4359789.1 NYN domain-containing protein [Pseudomonadota bacterium]